MAGDSSDSPPAASPRRPAESGLLKDIFACRVWLIFPLMLLYVIGIACVAPVVPGLLTDFFASRRAGVAIHCEDFAPGRQPPDCRNSYSDVVFWSSVTSFFTNSVLTFIMAPLVGKWSDVRGRRPFLLTAMTFGSLPVFVLLAHLTLDVSLFFYYPASVLGGAVSIISISLAFIADLLSPCHRATGFGALMASFSVGILIGPAIGSLLPPLSAAYFACACALGCIAYTYFLIPESLPADAMAEARQLQDSDNAKSLGRASGLRILLRSQLFIRLTVCLMVSGVVTDGLADLMIQYFKLLFNFTVKDVTLVFEMYGVCGLIVQTVVLKHMLAWLGEQRVLTVGLSAALLQMVAMAFVTAKWQAFGAVAMGSLGGMAFPAISSIKANNVAESEQGAMQGALYGAKALATGAGPLIFAAVFAGFTRTDSPLPYFPGAPFLLGAAIMTVAIGFAISIDSAAGRSGTAMAEPCSAAAATTGGDLEAPLLEGSRRRYPAEHIADLPLPNEGYVVGETVEALLIRSHSPAPGCGGGGDSCRPQHAGSS